MDVFVI